jgi:hypothetical protein
LGVYDAAGSAMLVPAGNQTMVECQGTSNIDDILGENWQNLDKSGFEA